MASQSNGAPLEGGDGTIDDLKQALVENLEHRGVLGKLKAQVRAEVFHTLEGPQDGVLPPPLSNENLLINELVRDYLDYNGYSNSLEVFLAESGQPSDKALDRAFIRDELGLIERRQHFQGDSKKSLRLPLLYGIVDSLRRWKEGSSKMEGFFKNGDGGRNDEGNNSITLAAGPPRVPAGDEDEQLEDEASPSPEGRDHHLHRNRLGAGSNSSNGSNSNNGSSSHVHPPNAHIGGREDPPPVLFTKGSR